MGTEAYECMLDEVRKSGSGQKVKKRKKVRHNVKRKSIEYKFKVK